MTAVLRCACALALVCLVSLLLPPEGALGVELQPREPRAASWLMNFGQLNKYLAKFFGGSLKKSKTHKKPTNATTSPPSNTTKFLPSNTTELPRPKATELPLPNAMKLSLPKATRLPLLNATKAPLLSPVELHPPTSTRGSRRLPTQPL